MRLSKNEREFIHQHPRCFNNFNSCLKIPTRVYDKYSSRIIKSVEFLVHLYVYDCTISLDKSLKKAEKNFSITREEILEYLRTALLFPYCNANNSIVIIDKKIFNQSFHTLEEAQEGLKEYLNKPHMLLQHLAYFASIHSSEIENFLSITLKLPERSNLFIISSDAIFLLSLCPELTLESLSRILTYRLGIPFSIIKDSLNLSICSYFCPKIQNFLMERLGVSKEDNFFNLYSKKATLMQTVNFLS